MGIEVGSWSYWANYKLNNQRKKDESWCETPERKTAWFPDLPVYLPVSCSSYSGIHILWGCKWMGFLKEANIYCIFYNARSTFYIHDFIYSILIATHQDWINMPVSQMKKTQAQRIDVIWSWNLSSGQFDQKPIFFQLWGLTWMNN